MTQELAKKEKKWIINIIHRTLISVHDCTGTKMTEYRRRFKILDKKLTAVCWTWNYDLPKKEFEIIKGIWEKLK